MEDAMDRACSTNGEKRNACSTLVENPDGKRPVGNARRRWVDNIEMDLRKNEMMWKGLIRLRKGTDRRLVSTVMSLRVP
jgi:hypothetical protein